MEKMKFETPDMTERNIDKIAALFPNCVTEALDEERSTPEHKVYKKAVNFETLKQMLSPDMVDGGEAYEFTWVGKKASIAEANRPIRKTLRPCPEESKDWDSTENLYIEGDNLEVLKLLQESYLGKVKMIYIDPPYNTGNDFIYRDDFDMEHDEYEEGIGHLDEDGNRLFKNTDTNGRFHSDWCSMIYPRLILARNLLSDDGVIFISIDDNEQENLKKVCGEVFGTDNFVANISWRRQDGQTNIGNFARVKEYILIYGKSKNVSIGKMPLSGKAKKDYQYKDEKGYYGRGRLREPVRGRYQYDLVSPSGRIVKGPWLIPENEFRELEAKNLIHWPEKEDGSPRRKIYLNDMLDKGQIPHDFWGIEFGTNQRASIEVENLFNKRYFDFPKPVSLIINILRLGADKDSIILDFFSGSATTAHAVMQLNAEEAKNYSGGGTVGKRKFIMVQLPEPCDEKSEAYKAGYKNICEIGKERIRRAGEKIINELKEKRNLHIGELNPSNPKELLWDKLICSNDNDEVQKLTFSDSDGENKREEGYSSDSYLYHPENLDVGFRVLKLDDTNMKDVYYAPGDYDQQMLTGLESNIKEDRTDLDLLFGCLLEWGLPLSMPYKSEKIGGCTVHTYNDGDLIACFDENIPESVVKEIAKRKPLRAVFRDSGFADSPAKINVFEIFKLLAPDTRVKVI